MIYGGGFSSGLPDQMEQVKIRDIHIWNNLFGSLPLFPLPLQSQQMSLQLLPNPNP